MSIIATAQIIAAQYVSEQKNVKFGSHASQQQCAVPILYACMDDEDHIASRL